MFITSIAVLDSEISIGCTLVTWGTLMRAKLSRSTPGEDFIWGVKQVFDLGTLKQLVASPTRHGVRATAHRSPEPRRYIIHKRIENPPYLVTCYLTYTFVG